MLQLFNVRNWHTLLFINATNLKLTVSAQKISLYFYRELPWKKYNQTGTRDSHHRTWLLLFGNSAYFTHCLYTNYTNGTLKTTWCRLQESNPQPTDYKSVALPIVLNRHGRNDRIWTCAPLFPKQVLCQAKLHSEILAGTLGFEPRKCQIQSLVPYHLATSQYTRKDLSRCKIPASSLGWKLFSPSYPA